MDLEKTVIDNIKRIRKEKFYEFALRVERDKLYYFALAKEQRTLVITSPADNKEQKSFLGYDWSNRKGAEGIVINQPGGMLYNPDDRFARGTLASAIRNSFIGNGTVTSVPEHLCRRTEFPRKDGVGAGRVDAEGCAGDTQHHRAVCRVAEAYQYGKRHHTCLQSRGNARAIGSQRDGAKPVRLGAHTRR